MSSTMWPCLEATYEESKRPKEVHALPHLGGLEATYGGIQAGLPRPP